MGHESFRGVTVDHLYPDCAACPKPAFRQAGDVDTLGTDVCGLCLKRWKRTMEMCNHRGRWKGALWVCDTECDGYVELGEGTE